MPLPPFGALVTARLAARLNWGVQWGLSYGIFLSLWALGIYAVAGAEPFRARSLTVVNTLAVYLAGGLAGGVALGTLLPLVRTGVGAFVTGALVMVPIGAFSLVAANRTHPIGLTLFVIGAGAVLLGGPLGLIARKRFRYQIVAEITHARRHTTRQAARAFRQRQYQQVVAQLAPIATELRGGDLRRFQEAQDRLLEHGHAP